MVALMDAMKAVHLVFLKADQWEEQKGKCWGQN
jgi:hypothetical protein